MTSPKILRWKDRSHRFTPHFHVEFYVGVIVRGQCEFECSGRQHVAGQGDLVLINPYEVHTAGCSEDVEYRAVYLDTETIEKYVEVHSAGGFVLSLEPTVVRQSPEAAAFAYALTETRALDDLEAPLSRILQRHCIRQSLSVNTADFQRSVIEALEKFSGEGPGMPLVSDLAAQFGMNAQTFSRVFHRVFGVPAVFFRNQLRLHKAESRLSQGERACDIAFECGFSDQAHLIRELKKSRGVTPKLYATAYQLIPE